MSEIVLVVFFHLLVSNLTIVPVNCPATVKRLKKKKANAVILLISAHHRNLGSKIVSTWETGKIKGSVMLQPL